MPLLCLVFRGPDSIRSRAKGTPTIFSGYWYSEATLDFRIARDWTTNGKSPLLTSGRRCRRKIMLESSEQVRIGIELT